MILSHYPYVFYMPPIIMCIPWTSLLCIPRTSSLDFFRVYRLSLVQVHTHTFVHPLYLYICFICMYIIFSGSNDNLVNVWRPAVESSTTPLFQFSEHTAAVKALAWCPWKSHLLASGGGTSDKTIRFWSCANGSLLNSVVTSSQVGGGCSVAELFSNNPFAVRKWGGESFSTQQGRRELFSLL